MFHIYGGKVGVDKKSIEKIVEMTDKVEGQRGHENSTKWTRPKAGIERSR